MLAIFTTVALINTCTEMNMMDSKLEHLVSEVQEVDSLAYEQLCDLQESHTSWFDDPHLTGLITASVRTPIQMRS